jgi:hypothetical protein
VRKCLSPSGVGRSSAVEGREGAGMRESMRLRKQQWSQYLADLHQARQGSWSLHSIQALESSLLFLAFGCSKVVASHFERILLEPTARIRCSSHLVLACTVDLATGEGLWVTSGEFHAVGNWSESQWAVEVISHLGHHLGKLATGLQEGEGVLTSNYRQ